MLKALETDDVQLTAGDVGLLELRSVTVNRHNPDPPLCATPPYTYIS